MARFFTSLALLPLGVVLATAARANTVVCTTTLEAPSGLAQVAAAEPPAPVEVSRCAPVQTTDALVVNRFYTWTAPYARGVDLIHQVTDLLGIAMAGPEGNRLMGLGFPDQTIIWDGSALQNTYQVLLEQQSAPIPWRTVDISSGFSGSLAAEQAQPAESLEVLIPVEASAQPVRGLW
ncbi:putative conserved secreted protein [Synechococcus sp. RS9909]|uniref:hypothetical protein n=1 Tax=unclassified Synechococcus TaxID=2626047 RepID=UPI00006905D8|nr:MULTISPECIES: hypothetical protein [unclassified Synechococcus]EAQ70020.1 possible Occludin/ELL family protein [Synechococcus sp. RS9917]QNI78325.1 putative conserved secreted protein [Synechococcus sp. RS9909]